MDSSRLNLLIFYTNIVVIISCSLATSYAINENEADRLALLEFKSKIVDDPLNVLTSWNDTTHFCQWRGVTCGHHHQRVIVLDLNSSKLTGSISSYIGNLSFMRWLVLYNNSFTNEIPSEIGHLHRLTGLYLFNNSLTGTIPSNISTCSNLIEIFLSYNLLLGKIPTQLGSLSKLQSFGIQANNLIGTIPPSLGNLSFLTLFSASENNLVGTIPASMGLLKNLKVFEVSLNNLVGLFPPSFFNLTSIEELYLANNKLEGTLPSDLGFSLPNLKIFNIIQNQFFGPIPISISNATNLELLNLDGNKLIGEVPSFSKLQKLQAVSFSLNFLGSGASNDLNFLFSLVNATSLKILCLGGNNFGGVLPACISNLATSVRVLEFAMNKIRGRIPFGIQNLTNLEVLSMWDNELTGNIPTTIGKIQKLSIIYLHGNKFTGAIPTSLGNLTMLTKFTLHDNHLQGLIPPSLGNCQYLLLLDLSHNHLYGKIPPQIFNISSLSLILNLSSNNLISSLSVEVGNLNNLDILDVSENKLSGKIPSDLGKCVKLEGLLLQGNLFFGHVPSSLSSLRGLDILDLSRNNFSGEIPKFLGSFLVLKTLNLSYNNFEGMVPTHGVFKNVSAIFVMGNNKLCGGIPQFRLPLCNFNNSKSKRRQSSTMKVVISIVSMILGIFLVMSILIILFWLRKRKDKLHLSSSMDSMLNLSYQDLLRATNGFSSTNLIGEGNFGSVYKGTLNEGRMIIAVKVLKLQQQGALKSFLVECKALRNIRHRNLVKVLTVCSGIDYQGNEFKALVYEFMNNGSLDTWLHRVPRSAERPRELNLLQRLDIAIDIAYAIEYLHHHCETPIVHCDLKPSNVLLDDEMTAHVGDFGLAKFLLQCNLDFSSQSSFIGVKGTVGYICPEYGMGSEVSTYGDVYSFGIILLELVTGKSPTDNMFNDHQNIHNLVKAALPENVLEVIDPILLQRRQSEDDNANNQRHRKNNTCQTFECLISILAIAVSCSVGVPSERMSISDVTAQLKTIRDKIYRAQRHDR